MKILIACDSFKGSASSEEINAAVARGLAKAIPSVETVSLPVADGGEGTVSALLNALGGTPVKIPVHDAVGRPSEALAGKLPDGAFLMETAQAAGLPQLEPGLRNPWNTSTRGVGEMLKAALNAGCRKIYLGLGGSATNDMGMGALSVLGLRLFDPEGNLLEGRGGDLARIASADASGLDPRLKETELILISDVQNPLFGEKGAAHVFAPQKGADPAMVEALEEGAGNAVRVLKRDAGFAAEELPGAGAAGGLGAGLMALAGGKLRPGIEVVLDMAGFDELVEGADYVITGEGCLDGQTTGGKVPLGVSRRAARVRVPVIAVAGAIRGDISSLYDMGLTTAMALAEGPITLEESMSRAVELAERAAFRLGRLIAAKREKE